uniref:FoP_duplication domain-containing protein n=1 Tax=Glossina austeni TaxID=7395 RepID=A0A1A9VWA6_GLOAU
MSASLTLNKVESPERFTTISSERTNVFKRQRSSSGPEYKLKSVVVSRANLLKRLDEKFEIKSNNLAKATNRRSSPSNNWSTRLSKCLDIGASRKHMGAHQSQHHVSMKSRLGESLNNPTSKTSSKGSFATCPKQHRGTRRKAEENNKRYCSQSGGNDMRSRHDLSGLYMRSVVCAQNKDTQVIPNVRKVTHHQRYKLSKDRYKDIQKNQQICKYNGNVNHSQQSNQRAKRKPFITKEDLDKELDQYMAMIEDR